MSARTPGTSRWDSALAQVPPSRRVFKAFNRARFCCFTPTTCWVNIVEIDIARPREHVCSLPLNPARLLLRRESIASRAGPLLISVYAADNCGNKDHLLIIKLLAQSTFVSHNSLHCSTLLDDSLKIATDSQVVPNECISCCASDFLCSSSAFSSW